MFTNSARESAFIFPITLPRWARYGDFADAEFSTHLHGCIQRIQQRRCREWFEQAFHGALCQKA